MKSLSEWSFNQPNLLLQFAIDPITENYVRKVPSCVFSYVTPTPLKAQLQLVSASHDVLENILELDSIEKYNPNFINFIAGNGLLRGSVTIAHRYGGFQFGYWADQLGDGRAITVGEYINKYRQIKIFKIYYNCLKVVLTLKERKSLGIAAQRCW